MGQVRVGFFQDFTSSDTGLIDGDRDGLRSLSSALRQLAATGTTQVALHELSFVEIHHGSQEGHQIWSEHSPCVGVRFAHGPSNVAGQPRGQLAPTIRGGSLGGVLTHLRRSCFLGSRSA